jgi:hypothetical protein
MKLHPCIWIAGMVLISGCDRSGTPPNESIDPWASVIKDNRVRALVKGHEHLISPMIDGSFDGMLTETLGDIHASLRRQFAEGGNHPSRPGRAVVDQVGRGWFSKRIPDDQAAAISIYHGHHAQEVTFSKEMALDEILLDGERYLRNVDASLYMIWNEHGLSNFQMQFTIKATRPRVVERLPANSMAHEYYLSGSFSLEMIDDEKGYGGIRLFRYDPLVLEGPPGSVKLLSREPLLETHQEIPQEAKRHLLESMRILTKHGPVDQENMIFRELLEKEPLMLRRKED